MFRELYENPWLATALMGALSFVGLALWMRRGTFLAAYLALFTVVTLADALRSGSWSPWHLLRSEWEDPAGLVFILLGDFRFFLVVERFAWSPAARPRDATLPPAVLTSLMATLAVPLVVLAMQQRYAVFATGQPVYLLWESLFVVLSLVYRLGFLPRRLAAVPLRIRRWLFEVTTFELVTYGLWIAADVLILLGFEWGFGLRVVPNILYFAGFLLFVAHRAPVEVSE